MIEDLIYPLYWGGLLFILGIIFFPSTSLIFGRFFDLGYAFGKTAALLVVTYSVWLLGSLKVAPFSDGTIWLVVFLGAAANSLFLISGERRAEIKKQIRRKWRVFLLEELLFFAALIFWSFLRGFQPDIQGLEKFMDYGFVNSLLRSDYFPPLDMWWAGGTINYYYFGHLVTALLIKISTVAPAVGYNLMVAAIFALTITTAFSLVANLFCLSAKAFPWPLLAGAAGSLLLSLGGNLHPLYWFLKFGNFQGYWYPDATRFIVTQFGAMDNTIHEFPLYSFVVADLHGHLLDLPFVLLFLGLLVSLVKRQKIGFGEILPLSLLLGVMFMTNYWDAAIYFSLGGLVLLYSLTRQRGFSREILVRSFTLAGGALFLAVLFSLPFHLHFRPMAAGLGLTDFRSPLWMLLVLWGFPLFTTLGFWLLLLTKKKSGDLFVLILFGLSWLLVLVPEVVYVKDIYIHAHQRANTMFKLTYQAFVLFSVASGYVLVRILSTLERGILKAAILFSLVFLLVFIFAYPFFAVRSYYGLTVRQGLDGLNYLKRLYPDDYAAVLWLRQNVRGQPVVVEAVGESYTDFGRVSANSGLPTIVGWPVHEWLWRGSFEGVGARTEEVRKIYEAEDLAETKRLLGKYQVAYVFLGALERQQYPRLRGDKFPEIGRRVFRSGGTEIYQVDREGVKER